MTQNHSQWLFQQCGNNLDSVCQHNTTSGVLTSKLMAVFSSPLWNSRSWCISAKKYYMQKQKASLRWFPSLKSNQLGKYIANVCISEKNTLNNNNNNNPQGTRCSACSVFLAHLIFHISRFT